jgi:cell division protein ZapD
MTTSDSTLLYEHPLNEKLFEQIDELMIIDSPLHTRSVIATIGDLLSIIQRGDLKSEMLKELDRHMTTFARFRESPHVDGARLDEYMGQMQSLLDQIHAMNAQLGAALKKNEFLSSVIQRCGIPGGTCDFDLPSLHHWLSRPFSLRHQQLDSWLDELAILKKATRIIMELTRNSVHVTPVVAQAGIFQKGLEKNHPCQLVQVRMPVASECYPEISGNKHHFTIRFMSSVVPDERAQQIGQDVEFSLGICII